MKSAADAIKPPPHAAGPRRGEPSPKPAVGETRRGRRGQGRSALGVGASASGDSPAGVWSTLAPLGSWWFGPVVRRLGLGLLGLARLVRRLRLLTGGVKSALPWSCPGCG